MENIAFICMLAMFKKLYRILKKRLINPIYRSSGQPCHPMPDTAAKNGPTSMPE